MQIPVQSIGTLSYRILFPTIIAGCSLPGRCHTEGSRTYDRMFCSQSKGMSELPPLIAPKELRTYSYILIRFAYRYIPKTLRRTYNRIKFDYRYVWYPQSGMRNHTKIRIRGHALPYNGCATPSHFGGAMAMPCPCQPGTQILDLMLD